MRCLHKLGLHKLVAAGLLIAAGTTGALACGGFESWIDADPRADYALSIVEVDSKVTAGDSPGLSVSVTFEVPTGGWSDAQLVPVSYFDIPYDGVYDIYVMAIPPDGPATDAIETMEASLDLPLGVEVAGYRLIAMDECITLLLDETALPGGDGCELRPLVMG